MVWMKKIASVISGTFLLLVILFQFQNCGQKINETAKFSVSFPKQNGQEKLLLAAPNASRSQAPNPALNIWGGDIQAQSKADLNCFGVIVGGPEASLQGNFCEDTVGNPFAFGVQKMGAGPGESVDLEVEAGANRIIRVLAWHAENAEACNSLIAGNKVKGQSLSKPFLIGSQTVALTGGANPAINIQASFQNSTELNGCDIFTADENQGQNNQQSQDQNAKVGGDVGGLDEGQTVTLNLFQLEPRGGGEGGFDPGQSKVFQATQIGSITPVDSQSVGNGTFQFEVGIEDGFDFSVSIAARPSNKSCQVLNGFGTIQGKEDFNGVGVLCEDLFSIGGNVSGLDPQAQESIRLLLLDSQTESSISELPIEQNGSYTFPPFLPNGFRYNVSIISGNPPGKICFVSNSNGIISGSNVTNVNIDCIEDNFTVGGEMSGLEAFLGATVTLRLSIDQGDGGTEFLEITDDEPFTFTSNLSSGQSYEVTIDSATGGEFGTPNSQNCPITNGSGNISQSNITNVLVECDHNAGGSGSGSGSGGSGSF